MKKRWLFILAILIIAATMFVACNSEVTDAGASAQPGKELVYATFGGGSKSLTTEYSFIDYTQLYWFYQATKADHFGTTGEVTGDNWAKVPGDSEGKGLDGTVGPFSQGLWSFNLAGYETKSTTEPTSGDSIHYGDYYYSGLVYSGASTGTVSLKYGDSNAIPVTVEPAGTTGKIYLDGITYAWDNNSTATGTVTLQIKVTPVEGSSWTDSKTWSYNSGYTLADYVLNNNSTPSVDIPKGTYNLEFTVCAVENNSVAYEFAKQSLSLTVFGSQTTTITGSLVEGLIVKNAHFVATDVASVIVIPTTTGASFETDKTPAGSGGSKKTTVTVPTGTLTTGTQNNMTIELVSIDIAQDVASQKSWSVATDSSAVAALTITLKEVVTTTDPTTGSVTVEEKAITTFDEPVTVTTYIETGLTDVEVFYNGDLDQPTDVTYDATTGCLTFKTTHFSEFYITSKSEVLNVETGVKYTTLAEAVDKAIDGQTLRLIKDITDPGIEIDKSLVLDLYGNTWACTDVNPTKTKNRAVRITAGKVVITSSRDGGKITDGYYQTQYAEQDDYNKTDSNLLYGCIRVEKDGEVEINNVTLENFRHNGLNVKVIGGKATLDNVIINSIYGGGIEVTSVEWVENTKYSVLPEEIGYAKLTNCVMTQDKFSDWCSVPVSVSGGATVDVYSTSYEGVYGVYVFSSGGTINIYGGTFTANGPEITQEAVEKQVVKLTYESKYDYSNYNHGGQYYSNTGSSNVNIYNGSINGQFSNAAGNRGHLLVYGGTYDHDPSAYVAPGYYADEIISGSKWEVKPYSEAESHLSVTKGSSTVYMPIDKFRDSVNSGNSYEGYTVTLLKDVDLGGNEWTPIGNYLDDAIIGTESGRYFAGSFNGGNHKISNLTITSDIGSYAGGLFGCIYNNSSDVTINNLTLENVNIDTAGGKQVGSLVGYVMSVGGNFSLNNVTVSGKVSAAKVVGGVVGVCSANNSSIANVTNNADVTAKQRVAGLVSQLSSNVAAFFDNCMNSGTISIARQDSNNPASDFITGTDLVAAGYVSHNNGATISINSNCINSGSIYGPLAAEFVGVDNRGMTYNGTNAPNLWTYTTDSSVNLVQTMKMVGVIENDSTKAYFKAIETGKKRSNAFDGIFYHTNTVYAVAFYMADGTNESSLNLLNNNSIDLPAKMTQSEWNDKSKAVESDVERDREHATIKLLTDLNWTGLYSFGTSMNPLVIDLNGKTLTASDGIIGGTGNTKVKFSNGVLNYATGATNIFTSSISTSNVSYESVSGTCVPN